MNKRLIAYAALLALTAASPAFAQAQQNHQEVTGNVGLEKGRIDPNDNARYNGRDPSYERPAAAKAEAKIEASKYVGQDVVDDDGDTIGTIESVVTGPDGTVQQVVMDVGGVMGIGGRKVAVPAHDLSAVPGDNGFMTSLSEAQIEAMPDYQS